MLKHLSFIAVILSFFTLTVSAQNIQLHYDFRHSLVEGDAADIEGENFLFTTVEMFKPDKWGSTFFFIDMAYSGSKGSINTAYWEIARDLNFWKFPVCAHVEYNGGIVEGVPGAIPNAYLVGASYPFVVGNANLSTYFVYKYNAFKKVSNDAQWTFTWFWKGLDNRLTLTGFIDVWSENKDRLAGIGGKKIVLMSQPQFWFNATDHFSIGSEIGISSNFYDSRVYALPTMAAKWNF